MHSSRPSTNASYTSNSRASSGLVASIAASLRQRSSLVGWPLAIGVATVLAGLWALRPQAA
jgi:uncharacterized membrane protein (UPF0136 family)